MLEGEIGQAFYLGLGRIGSQILEPSELKLRVCQTPLGVAGRENVWISGQMHMESSRLGP